MNVLCLIPARGGSKGIPKKNLRLVSGISLVGHAVLAARAFAELAVDHRCEVVVDTDDTAIAAEAERWGGRVPFLRRPALASDEASTLDAVIALLERLGAAGETYDSIVLLQPTSPLRAVSDIVRCWAPVASGVAPSTISVVRDDTVEHAMRIDHLGRCQWVFGPPPSRRQEHEWAFRPSGAVYVHRVQRLLATRAFIVPNETVAVEQPAERAIDVDTLVDLTVAQAIHASLPVASVSVGGRRIGDGHPCFVIAEAGVNHNGDAGLAHQLVDVAADAQADAVKFQIFDAEQLAAPDAAKAAYQSVGESEPESQLAMLRRLSLPLPVFAELKAHAAERGLMFLSTPFDPGSAEALLALGVPALKIPSGEITNHRFLSDLAAKGLPLLVSTGMSNMVEVAEALSVIRRSGNPPVALFHCVTNYPARPEECNLAAIGTMRDAFKVPVGWSDHTDGIDIALAAVAGGAELLEKHFTLDRSLPGPDHAASIEPAELSELMRAVRRSERARGDGEKRPVDAERELAAVARRSLHAARRLTAGTVLQADDLIALRPGTGVPPSRIGTLLGRRVRADVEAFARIGTADIE